jgi:hypothetical protein
VAGPPAWRRWLVLLLALRALLGLFGVVLSQARPISPAEQQLPLSASLGLGDWLSRALVLPWLRWDTDLYVGLAENGYRPGDPAIQLHPLYPWLGQLLHVLLGLSGLLALLIVSSVAALALAVAVERLALLDLEPAAARRATLLLLLAPPAFILLAAYSEGLFLLCSALALLWAREQRWWLAGLAGFGAALTRQQGVFLALPLLWEMAGAAGGWRALARRWRWWPALALPALGLVAFVLFRALALGDVDFRWAEPRSWIYSLVISKHAEQVVPVQAFLLPPHALWLALTHLAAPDLQISVDLTLGVLFVALLALGWGRLRPSYRVYALTLALVAFAYHTGPKYPYMGLPRHLLLALPVFFPLGAWAAPRRRLLPLLLGSFLGYLFLGVLFFLKAWVP